jgi:hypothetical protein
MYQFSIIIVLLILRLTETSNIGVDETAIAFQDSFEDFPGAMWQGDVDYFEAASLGGTTLIQQTAGAGNGVNKLLIESNVLYGSWEFSVHFDGFSTSNQNRAFVWITSDDTELQNGIAVRIGENGSQKFVRLLDYTGTGNPIEILRSQESLPDNVPIVYVSLRHDPDGTWHLGTKYDTNSEYNWVSGNYKLPNTYVGKYFAFQTVYTATRSDKFRFGTVTIRKYPMFIIGFETTTPNSLAVYLSEDLTSINTEDLIISIDGYHEDITNRISGNKISIELNQYLGGGIWTIRIFGLRDPLFENMMNNLVFDFEIFDTASLFDVVINEFTPRPTTDRPIRFVELYNRSQKFLNLENWTFGRQNQSIRLSAEFGTDTMLPPEGIAIIGQNLNEFINPDSTLYFNQNIPTLGRTTDSIWLKSSEGTLVDSVRYDNSWSTILKDGLSVERINPHYASMDRVNWSNNPIDNTLGQTNFYYDTTTINSKINSVFVDADKVTILFSHYVRITDETRITIDGLIPQSTEHSDWHGKQIRITPTSLDWINQRMSFVEMIDLSSYDGKETMTVIEEIAHPPDIGSLEINEIMYQPLQNRYANFGDQTEYVEIKNRRPYRISLKDVFIRDTIDKNGQMRTWEPELPELWQIDANGYAVLFPDTSNSWANMRLPSFFEIDESSNWARISRSTLGLTSSGRGVHLQHQQQGVLDSVYYSPDWHHPLLRDPRGISLEKVESNIPSVHSKWTSSSDYLGGTPGRANSAWMQLGDDESENGLFIEPNPFSPDNDGHEDYTQIKLNLPHPGAVIRVRIFDRFGRLVRNLTNDTIIGNNFEVLWNGFDDNNHVLQTGVYITHVEVFHSEIKMEKNFKKAVVLVRKK